jgi:hypothetical protein
MSGVRVGTGCWNFGVADADLVGAKKENTTTPASGSPGSGNLVDREDHNETLAPAGIALAKQKAWVQAWKRNAHVGGSNVQMEENPEDLKFFAADLFTFMTCNHLPDSGVTKDTMKTGKHIEQRLSWRLTLLLHLFCTSVRHLTGAWHMVNNRTRSVSSTQCSDAPDGLAERDAKKLGLLRALL